MSLDSTIIKTCLNCENMNFYASENAAWRNHWCKVLGSGAEGIDFGYVNIKSPYLDCPKWKLGCGALDDSGNLLQKESLQR